MLSSNVSPGDVAIASQYNNLRKDAFIESFASPVYNAEGLLISATINGVATTFTYDNNGDLIGIDDGGTEGTITRDGDGALSTISYA